MANTRQKDRVVTGDYSKEQEDLEDGNWCPKWSKSSVPNQRNSIQQVPKEAGMFEEQGILECGLGVGLRQAEKIADSTQWEFLILT